MRTAALASFLSLALVVCADPIRIRDTTITLPIAKRINGTGIANLAKHDQQRAKALFERGSGKTVIRQAAVVGSQPATNQVVDYVVDVSLVEVSTTY